MVPRESTTQGPQSPLKHFMNTRGLTMNPPMPLKLPEPQLGSACNHLRTTAIARAKKKKKALGGLGQSDRDGCFPSYGSKERTIGQAAERTHTPARLLTTPGQRAKQWAKLWAWLQRLGPGPGHSLVQRGRKEQSWQQESELSRLGKSKTRQPRMLSHRASSA